MDWAKMSTSRQLTRKIKQNKHRGNRPSPALCAIYTAVYGSRQVHITDSWSQRMWTCDSHTTLHVQSVEQNTALFTLAPLQQLQQCYVTGVYKHFIVFTFCRTTLPPLHCEFNVTELGNGMSLMSYSQWSRTSENVFYLIQLIITMVHISAVRVWSVSKRKQEVKKMYLCPLPNLARKRHFLFLLSVQSINNANKLKVDMLWLLRN